MRRLFVAAAAATLTVVLSGCGATAEGKLYYESEDRKYVVNSQYHELTGKLDEAFQLGVLGTVETYVGNVREGAPSKCPPPGKLIHSGYAGLIDTGYTGLIQRCAQDGKFAFVGTMIEGKIDPSLRTGVRVDDLEAWIDKDRVVSGGYTSTNGKTVKPGPKGTPDDIKNADQALIKVFKDRIAKHLDS